MVTSNKKRRFHLGEYQSLKKQRLNSVLESTLAADAQRQHLEAQLTTKGEEIYYLRRKLHKKEEIVRRRKRNVYLCFCLVTASMYTFWFMHFVEIDCLY